MATKDPLLQEIAGNGTDPQYFSGLSFLPNPDEVLRKMGKTQTVYNAIKADAHVAGELRAIRAGLLGFEYHISTSGNRRADKQALALCNALFAAKPAPYWQWSDIIWSIAEAVMYGYRALEVVWDYKDGYIMPVKVIPRPNRRFVFTYDGEPRLLTRDNPTIGDELPPKKFLITRHMPTFENPYGTAIFSSCFWPYTFKHGGFKFWSQFCSRFGVPWTIGEVPAGTPDEVRDKLAQNLRTMVETAIAVIPDDGSIKILEPQSKGETHETFINSCNREMSKALTSQTLATEIQGGGSRAAAQTHRGREQAGFECDRDMVTYTFCELLQWVTELNFPDAVTPIFEFYAEEEARQEWVDVLDKARHFLPIPKKFAYERLQITPPDDGEEVIETDKPAPTPQQNYWTDHNAGGGCNHDHTASQIDAIEAGVDKVVGDWEQVVNPMLASIQDALKDAVSIQDFQKKLEAAGQGMDMSAMTDTMTRLLFANHLAGRTTDDV